MIKRKTLFFMFMFFLLTSCGTWDSFKRGMTGEKLESTDEFLVQKKDPLILPPDFEELPTPDERIVATQEISSFEKKLEISSSTEDVSLSGSSTEESILKKIKKK